MMWVQEFRDELNSNQVIYIFPISFQNMFSNLFSPLST